MNTSKDQVPMIRALGEAFDRAGWGIDLLGAAMVLAELHDQGYVIAKQSDIDACMGCASEPIPTILPAPPLPPAINVPDEISF